MAGGTWGPGTHPQFFALIEAKPSSLSDLARRHVQTPTVTEGLKIRGRARINVVGIICPPG